MRIVRVKRPDGHFTIIDNALLRDERISERARGLLVRILSYPDDWETNSSALAEQCKEGRGAIRTAMAELEAAGYMARRKRQISRGRWVTDTFVYDHPVPPDSTPDTTHASGGTGGMTPPPGTATGGTVPPPSRGLASTREGSERVAETLPEGSAPPSTSTFAGDGVANSQALATTELQAEPPAAGDDPWADPWDPPNTANVQVGPETGFRSSDNRSSVDRSSVSRSLSTEDCYEDALGHARAATTSRADEDQKTEPDESWRKKDRRLFEELLGAPCAQVVKHSPRWAPGHFAAAALYKALAKPIEGDTRQLMRYPGKVLAFKDETDQLDDWLWETGIQPCTEGHGKRRPA